MKRLLLILIFLLFMSPKLYAAPDADGNEWNSWPRFKKLVYIDGLITGINTAVIGVAGNIIMGGERPSKHIYRYLINKVTVGQIVDGIDLLYKDFKNRNIYVIDAVYVVYKQIKGTPPEDIERILLWLRSGRKKNDYLVVKDNEGKIVRVITFP